MTDWGGGRGLEIYTYSRILFDSLETSNRILESDYIEYLFYLPPFRTTDTNNNFFINSVRLVTTTSMH